MAQVEPIGVPLSRHEGRLEGIETIGRKSITPDMDTYAQAHFTVLQHMTQVSPYIDKYKDMVCQQNPDRSKVWITREHNCWFNEWLKVRFTGRSSSDDTLLWLAKGLKFTIVTWQGYDINGYTFYTIAQDKKSTVQNSGVCIDAFHEQFDTTGPRGLNSYYGFIEEIWELDYVLFKIPCFDAIGLSIRKV